MNQHQRIETPPICDDELPADRCGSFTIFSADKWEDGERHQRQPSVRFQAMHWCVQLLRRQGHGKSRANKLFCCLYPRMFCYAEHSAARISPHARQSDTPTIAKRHGEPVESHGR